MTSSTSSSPAIESELSFADYRLSAATQQALAAMGITHPTPIQAQALPVLLEGHDVIGQARTGSGKTLAFGIPALEIVDVRQRGVQVLVLTPTRELAVQVGGVLEELGKSRGINVGLLFGGRAEGPQRLMLKQGVHAVVGTPGRLLDMLNQGALWLDKVRFLVLDEADEMLDRGFAPDVERILDRTTTARQTAMFSATVPDWVRKTADRHLNHPETIHVDPNPEDAAPVDHIAYDIHDGDKMAALKDLLDHQGDGSIIVFGRTKHGVKKLAKQLEQAGYPVAALQGNLSQNARDQVMDDFRSGNVRILVATNVAARGLDISHVEQVINFELPESHQLLTHRIGRTGRMGREGRAVTLLGPEDSGKWRQLERGLGRSIARKGWRGAKAANGDSPEVAAEVSQPVQRNIRPPRPRRERREQPAVTAPRHDHVVPSSIRPKPVVTHNVLPESSELPASGGSHLHPEAEDQLSRFLERISATGNTVSTTREDSPRRQRNDTQLRERPERQERPERAHGTQARGPRFEIECSACGIKTTVPFEPTNGRPVYCRDCYAAMKPDAPKSPKAGRHDVRSSGSDTTYAD